MPKKTIDWLGEVARSTPSGRLEGEVRLLSEELDKVRLCLSTSNFPPPYARKNWAQPGRDILVIGDSHCTPGYNNRRFDWLGRMVQDLKPSTVVDIGDFYGMNSLSGYEKPGSKHYAVQNYAEDVLAGIDAQLRLERAFSEMGADRPRLIRTLGNHDGQRLERALSNGPRLLRGLLATTHYLSREFGWEEYPFMQEVAVHGVTFRHFYRVTNGLGPQFVARNCAQRKHKSYVFGHCHRFDFWHEGPVYCTAVGWFPGGPEHWLPEGDQTHWDAGITILKGVQQGRYWPEFWPMERIRAAYG